MSTLRRSPLFWIGLALRLSVLPFFGSTYVHQYFIPFLDAAVAHPGTNPWTLLPPAYFPYGSFLFAWLYLPRQLAYLAFGPACLGDTGLSIALCKLPLLVAELVLLSTLAGLTTAPKRLLSYLWLNPILIYISYVYVQLDVVVTATTCVSLVLLIKGRLKGSAVLLGCALCSKFTAAIAVPLMLTYLWNREFPPQALRKIAVWLAVFLATASIGFAPVWAGGDFSYASVASPEALRILATKLDFGNNSYFYLGAALVMAALGRLCLSTRMSNFGVFYATGLVFGLLVIATNTMPGWYYWPLPFLAVLYANHHNAPRFPWYLTQVAYLLNFALLPALSSTPLLTLGEWQSLTFTTVQTCFASLLLIMWMVTLRDEAKLDRLMKPLVIGIAGDSAAGKNRLSAALTEVFGARHTIVVEGDDYHKWERGDERYRRYTHLSPRANNLRELDQHTRHLMEGRLVLHRSYDHDTGRFTPTREIKASRTMIVQGLHSLYLRATRDNHDLKIFLDPDPLVKLAWKLQRDVHERGHTLQKVLTSLEDRRRDVEMHIAPQRHFADWIIEAMPLTEVTRDTVLAGQVPAIYTRHVLWNDADIEGLLEQLAGCKEVAFELERVPENLDRVALSLRGEPSQASVASMAEALLSPLRHITRASQAPLWRAGQDGLLQIIALVLVQHGRSSRSEEVRFGHHQTPGEHHRRSGSSRDGVGDRTGSALPSDAGQAASTGLASGA